MKESGEVKDPVEQEISPPTEKKTSTKKKKIRNRPSKKSPKEKKQPPPSQITPQNQTGSVSFQFTDNIASDAYLISSGKKYRSGNVPVGSYSVYLTCSGQTAKVRSYTVTEGKYKKFTCQCGITSCD